jgi:saccharopine dehydrogenase-like NADP-dependent oxidoreductase
MHKVLILGAGKIGALISGLLAESGDYDVTLGDVDSATAESVVKAHGSRTCAPWRWTPATQGRSTTISAAIAARRHLQPALLLQSGRGQGRAQGQRALFRPDRGRGSHPAVRRISRGASRAFVPQCGLAPGFISIAANELTKHFDELRSIKLRVGALPQHPNNVLKYSLTWSTEGLINEYGNPCESVVDGKIVAAAPLEGLEEIEIDGTLYEAFNTSGGLGSLAESYGRQCEQINYKTMRYPGHCAQMRLLMNDLKLNSDRATLKRVLEHAVPQTLQDVVIVYAAVSGKQDGELREENYVNKVYPQVIAGRLWSAIQVTTAAGITAVVDLVMSSPRKYKGFVAQEQFSLPDILDNRFGQYYAPGGTKDVSSAVVVKGQAGHQRRVRGAQAVKKGPVNKGRRK